MSNVGADKMKFGSILAKVVCAVLCLIVTSACAPRQTIKYPLDDVSAIPNSQFAKSVLAIKPFVDKRNPLQTDCPRFDVSTVVKNDTRYYYNCDNHYKTESVAREVANAVAEHIKYSKLFDNAIVTDVPTPAADYLLTGRMAKFDGLKEFSVGSIVAAQFGLIGALVNLAMIDSKYEATTAFEGLEIVRLKDNVVVWRGDITGHIDGADTADPYGWSAYWKADLSLKDATSKLVSNLAQLTPNPLGADSIPAPHDTQIATSQPVAQSPQSTAAVADGAKAVLQ